VLLAIPGDYGAGRVFTCIEPFLTPRMAAEALVLFGLAAALRQVGSPALAWAIPAALLIAAALFHPIMATAGVCALYWLHVGERKPALATALAIAAFALAALALSVMQSGQWGRFDPEWLALVRDRSPYLFLDHWQLDDWSRLAVAAATLLIGAGVLPDGGARTLSRTAVVVSLGGIAMTWIACDLLHLVLFTQLQPWRWQWLGTVAAALLLPATIHILWSGKTAGRTTALLLLSAWIFASNPYALAAALAALAAQRFVHRLKPDEARWVLLGAVGMLVLASVWRLASNFEFTDAHYLDPSIPLWIRRAMSFSHDGAAPAAIIALAWWLAVSRRFRPGLMVLAALAGAVCVALLPQTVGSWTAREFSAQRVAQFTGLRRHIPERGEVFWPESPVAVWMLLGRPSYLSVIQTSGMVFSRGTALEMKRRAALLGAAIGPSAFMSWTPAGSAMALSPQQLMSACDARVFDFLVTSADLGRDPVANLPAASNAGGRSLRLYRCKAAG
jgi:hypothetical protein